MNSKENRPAHEAQGRLGSFVRKHDKDSEYSQKRQIRLLFLQGGKYTAKEINQIIRGNDARKIISLLRSEGMNIKDVVLDNQCKLYWLDRSPKNTLFDQKGGKNVRKQ